MLFPVFTIFINTSETILCINLDMIIGLFP